MFLSFAMSKMLTLRKNFFCSLVSIRSFLFYNKKLKYLEIYKINLLKYELNVDQNYAKPHFHVINESNCYESCNS